MRLRPLTIAVLLASLCLLSVRGEAKMIDNPAYANWSKFKVGTSVTRDLAVMSSSDAPGVLDATAEPPGGNEKHLTSVLTSLTPSEAVVEETATEILPDATIQLWTHKITYPAQLEEAEQSKSPRSKGEEKVTGLTEGDQELVVAGKKMKVHWVESVISIGGETSKSKMWMSDDVPGGIVKQVVTKSDRGKTLMKSKLNLIGFKAA